MNKLELISILRQQADLSKQDAVAVIELFFDRMASALARGDRVEFRGLCSFYVKTYKDYIGRNPKTGEKVKIKPKKLPFFKAGKEFEGKSEHLNPNKNWVVYLVRCADQSLYCGITNNLEKRLEAHNLGKGAKYIRSRIPVELFGNSSEMTKSEAL
jgi:integration host factor subunit beta